MAIAGTWKSGAVTPLDYAGATRWGTGVNPVHAIRDGAARPNTTKENLLPLGEGSDYIPENVVGAAQWGYSNEDAALYPGEDYRYMVTDHPNWGEEAVVGNRRTSTSDKYSGHSEGDWPAWGPHEEDQLATTDGFPLSGPPGGAAMRSHSDDAELEANTAIAVPTRGSTGGWLNKAHGAVEEAETSDQSQYEVTTSLVQLHKTRNNNAAVSRGTDAARSPIETRLTGQKVKSYAKSIGMGGGPGTPDMFPRQQDLPYRPWFYRTAGVAPMEQHTWNEMTAFQPIQRTLPTDAGETVVNQEAPTSPDNYGYSAGDYYGG
jgi:hypothetical protein